MSEETDLAVVDPTDLEATEPGAIELLVALEKAGALDEVSLTLTDPTMVYDRWEDLGRFLGNIDRRSRWWVGDWMNFGEAVYGEQAAQGVDVTTKDRYNEAERVTGLDRQTLMNIRSVCGRVPKERRRKELGFWIHAEVAALEPDEQIWWLQHAITEGLSRQKLRQAIRASKGLPAPEQTPEPEAADPELAEGDGGDAGENVPESDYFRHVEHVAAVAQNIVQSWQPTSDGSYLVPADVAEQLVAALGEA